MVLKGRPGKLVIFIDEIDAVRSLPFSADEFFAGIRECYNRRTEDPDFHRLAFCLLGVATPADLIRDSRTTPFNIGKRIELTDFTEAEAAPLAVGFTYLLDGEPVLLQNVGVGGAAEARALLDRRASLPDAAALQRPGGAGGRPSRPTQCAGGSTLLPTSFSAAAPGSATTTCCLCASAC